MARAMLIFPVAFTALSAVILLSTPRITGWMLPMYSYVIEHAYPEDKLISIENRGDSIMYHMEIHKHIQGFDLPLVDTMVSSIHSSIQFITLIIYYSLLFAWPALTVKKRLTALYVSLPFLILFILVDIPVTIISSIDIACIQKLNGIPLADTFPRRIVEYLSHFINNGGRQFYAVTLFILTVIPLRLRFSTPKPVAVAPHDPCPCGSGKHYRNCCGKK